MDPLVKDENVRLSMDVGALTLGICGILLTSISLFWEAPGVRAAGVVLCWFWIGWCCRMMTWGRP